MAYQAAFEAPFRIVENKKRASESSPSHSVVFNFTREEAMKAAQWFMAMAERVDTDGTTCSVWDKDRKEACDVPGFPMYAACWGKSGKLSPPMPETVTNKAPANRNDLPF